MSKKLMIAAILLLSLFTRVFAESPNWYNEDIWTNEDRGFLWYPDKTKVKKKAEDKPAQVLPENALQQFEMLQKWVDEARKVAIMNPTEQNLKTYIALQEVVMNKSAAFTDQWQRVIWQNPELDYSQRGRPNNKLAMDEYDSKRMADKASAIRALAGKNGVMFAFRSDCPYCHAMAPILRQFAETYGIRVMPVSLDGRGLPQYPNPLPNNGIAQRLNIQAVPALYVMDTKTKQFKPIGFGVISQAALEDRFLALSRPVGTLY